MQLFLYVYFNFVVSTLLVDLGIASYVMLNEGAWGDNHVLNVG